ncbi:TCP-1/cpn60 chaperonin family protein [Halorientalis halophila]|uniref:TCP-1/cpn60 chaperonin family protein n=1 Tax=Halorientalis halophila TaxID=3108499 RepID=UPI00300BE46E
MGSFCESARRRACSQVRKYGVLDPAAVKQEAVESATEAATMIVRIDDVIAAE